MKKMVLQLTIENEKSKGKALKVVAKLQGVNSVAVDMEENKMTVTGEADPVEVTAKLRKHGFGFAELVSVEGGKEEDQKEEGKNKDADFPNDLYVQRPYYNDYTYVETRPYYYGHSYVNDNPNACTIC